MDEYDYEDENGNGSTGPNIQITEPVDNDVDEDTVRIMVSTDNHLGFEEKDPIRGNDSFAAFEEVLSIAKRTKCDMVLLAGDLFHENKPSRKTLYRTMDILRRYCLGPECVHFHIVSDQKHNFRSTIHGTANFEDPYYSVDLPIFAIHGNHDDPVREGGTDVLAALDLLAVSNLLNYFGRHDEVDKLNVSPILMKKGSTNVALYGIGSMRDERMNRMWTGKKVQFLKPSGNEDDDDDDDPQEWFKILALHQNRDAGRGSKNCVHESMIPDWLDLIVWGHEHECRIIPDESTVGTFRITQPGSSVATSLSFGESVSKNVGILDVRGSDFRLIPVPLSQVRSFVIKEVSLQNQRDLQDKCDPRLDDKITEFLAKEVKALISAAREQTELMQRDAAVAAGIDLSQNQDSDVASLVSQGLKYKLEKPEQVLIRLKVEHSGYNNINNQRFGSRFVEDVANNSDILLFHRKRTPQDATADKASTKKSRAKRDEPIAPVDLDEIGIDELIKDNLESVDAKLEILEEQFLASALDEFVEKELRDAFDGTVDKVTASRHKKLVQRGAETNNNAEGDDNKVTTSAAVREICSAELEKKRQDATKNMGAVSAASKRSAETMAKPAKVHVLDVDDDDDEDDNKLAASESAKSKTSSSRKATQPAAKALPAKTSSKPTREAAKAASAKLASTLSDDDLDFSDDDDKSEEEKKPASKSKAKGRASTTTTATRTTGSKRKSASESTKTAARGKAKPTLYDSDESDVDDDIKVIGVANGKGWGTANSQSQVNKRERR